MKPTAHVVVASLALFLFGFAPHAWQGDVSQNAVASETAAPAFQGAAAEEFLKTAKILRVWDLGKGITRPKGVALELDGLAHDAVFKWIDARKAGSTTLEDGTVDADFWDTWQTEIAAYRLDRMIGLGMVPATVERPVQGTEGSLMWWAESEMTEEERIDQGIRPADGEAWTRRVLEVRLFDELISNVDRHMNNLLITEDFEIRLIDHSRSFRNNKDLRAPEKLPRFSRSLLEALERLTFDELKAELGRYLNDDRIERLLQRRDAILELARERVERFGEAAIIYP